jgi:hypothetical protein
MLQYQVLANETEKSIGGIVLKFFTKKRKRTLLYK